MHEAIQIGIRRAVPAAKTNDIFATARNERTAALPLLEIHPVVDPATAMAEQCRRGIRSYKLLDINK